MKKIKIDEIARRAKDSSRKLALASTDAKNAALDLIADELIAKSGRIIAENRKDVSEARKKGLSGALIDRLVMTEKTIRDIAKGVRDIAALPDPVGEVLSEWRTPSGMRIKKVKVPLGVVGMIYESRPNVTVDSSALCLKSSNAIILRGGKEAINSNRILVRVIKDALEKSGRPSEIPQEIIQFIDDTDRRRVYEMVRQDALIDLIIPRGGEEM
ncbi:MAG: gamma-glutamyl-phosphate reductase, partial [Elusimicrobia bacterium]|nr:gamma-glutamyl-phosphate reductase [Elusimicrobiota bacterium]